LKLGTVYIKNKTIFYTSADPSDIKKVEELFRIAFVEGERGFCIERAAGFEKILN
tara:strand:+ start:419 stop:583 length:165 start_codon:yes stop_codon:yes gene_type:complete